MAAAQLTPLHQSGARILSVVPVTGVALAAAGLALMASAAASAQSLPWILGALALGALAAATARRGVLREAWAALAVVLIVATSTAAATWAGAEAATAGLVAVLAAGLLLATAPLARRRGVPLPATAAPVIELVAGAALATGVAVAALDSDVLWIALVAAGVSTAAVAARSDRHRVGWLSGVLMVLSTWVRLADSGVETPEAYTAPAAVALLVFGWFRRRRNPETASWTAYGGGLVLLLVPSFLRGLADADGPRPLLLAAVALTVVLVGGWRRLQAPLVVGGAVLALHALGQLGPAIAFSPLPKWVSLGAVGLLLLTLGATYERRIAEVRRLAGVISRMD
jgi:hypothetical protein